eukprot:TRINITY_DN69628_c0_g1_i1.p1 TRINITY_DN69628_c0_g1~~TRINITY_DN69628_c0_g1_i1.p1  ORF type:complete len:561 (-),score=132.97 TRINITY_DN69628_c0_g1_i1:47-1729(-)
MTAPEAPAEGGLWRSMIGNTGDSGAPSAATDSPRSSSKADRRSNEADSDCSTPRPKPKPAARRMSALSHVSSRRLSHTSTRRLSFAQDVEVAPPSKSTVMARRLSERRFGGDADDAASKVQFLEDYVHGLETEREQQILDQQLALANAMSDTTATQRTVETRDEELSKLRETTTIALETISDLEAMLLSRDNEVAEAWMEAEAHQERIDELEASAKAMDEALAMALKNAETLQNTVKDQNPLAEAQRQRIEELEALVKTKVEALAEAQKDADSLRVTVKELQLKLDWQTCETCGGSDLTLPASAGLESPKRDSTKSLPAGNADRERGGQKTTRQPSAYQLQVRKHRSGHVAAKCRIRPKLPSSSPNSGGDDVPIYSFNNQSLANPIVSEERDAVPCDKDSFSTSFPVIPAESVAASGDTSPVSAANAAVANAQIAAAKAATAEAEAVAAAAQAEAAALRETLSSVLEAAELRQQLSATKEEADRERRRAVALELEINGLRKLPEGMPPELPAPVLKCVPDVPKVVEEQKEPVVEKKRSWMTRLAALARPKKKKKPPQMRE